ncbi:probable phospholipid-transporting ATPase IF [Anneissia japonica]|uniref:probable phospholipid-transporting ATPase IF n=1 Tax=Anneissia japonica TaxID=1529436 RepID=UPI0014259E07|nr:probable phospholipid-transporting ATPase IF [Anneissia japonica]
MASIYRWITYTLGIRKRDVPENRTVLVGNKLPVEGFVFIPQKFPDNTVKSSKYTLINFLPKNLFEQFRRIANFYFLIVALLQFIIDSPVSPITSVLPLVFVITVTGVKQGYEDWLRHQADFEVNNRPMRVIRDGSIVDVRSMDIRVGDIVRCKTNQEFPCDMVVLSSENPEGECYVTTANLDGETNLKMHRSLPITAILQDVESLESFRGFIECEQPHTDLYKFIGRMKTFDSSGQESVYPLSPENVLLRGARLKNVQYIFGVAVNTGEQTKMALNSKSKGQKFSCLERSMNKYLGSMLILLVVETLLCTILKYAYDANHDLKTHWYFYSSAVYNGAYDKSFQNIMSTFLSFLVLFNYIIPISLYVTLELQKFTGSMFFAWDIDIYDEQTDQRAKANTSDLNEELGQVEYMFTDKTGTLTENNMQFRQCSVDGVKYEDVNENLKMLGELKDMTDSGIEHQKNLLKEFLLCMGLCHTVHVHKDSERNGIDSTDSNVPLDYQASSPDEKALVEAAARFGVKFLGGTSEYLEVEIDSKVKRYELLHVLEFDPTRKCMSSIVKTPEGEIRLLCKGAESTILHKSVSGNVEATLQHVNDYAVLGLRTLCFGYRILSPEVYNDFHEKLAEASSSLEDREKKLNAVFEIAEQELHLVGATAVEDELQDGVPETIEKLREAGIKVWVLTGDKQETAVNISHSCDHFKASMSELYLVKQTEPEQISKLLSEYREMVNGSGTYAFVVDGPSLALALNYHSDELLQVCIKCVAVLCCRMSPLQKAQTVKLVKESVLNPTTMAIGDGANDVSMIQEAHVGLGIMGKEGRQAVRCSDYAFARFKFLQKVLLVHGPWYYIRVAMTVQYFFYKNIAFITAQFFYAFYTQFSQQTVFESFYLTFYNITCTALPIMIYGIFEQHLPKKMLLNNPLLYKEISKNSRLSLWECCYWCVLGFYHAFLFYYVPIWLLGDDIALQKEQHNFGIWSFGTIIFTNCVIVVNLKLIIETCHWNILAVASMVITIVGYPTLASIYSGVIWFNVTGWEIFSSTSLYWVFFEVHKTVSMWFCILLSVGMAFLPDFIYKMLMYYFYPSQSQIERRSKYRNAGSLCVFYKRTDRLITPNGSLDNNSLGTENVSFPADHLHNGFELHTFSHNEPQSYMS